MVHSMPVHDRTYGCQRWSHGLWVVQGPGSGSGLRLQTHALYIAIKEQFVLSHIKNPWH